MIDLFLLPVSVALVVYAMLQARKLGSYTLRLALVEFLVILACVVAWFAVRTVNYLAGPPDGDLYAQTWGFQAIVFVIFYFPRTMLAIGVWLVAQSAFIRRRRSRAV